MSNTLPIAVTGSNSFNIDDYNAKEFAGARKPSDTLDQASFLQLLVTQLVNQDPTAPMSNNEFAQQVTGFSSLTATQDMQEDMAWVRSSSLIGSQVDLTSIGSTSGEIIKSGVVAGVALVEGVPQIVVGDQTYKMTQIKNVYTPPASVPATSTPTPRAQTH